MATITKNFVPKYVAPSKLDKVLAYCTELSDENKQKVIIIQDIAKLGKLLEYPQLSSQSFYQLYELPTVVLEATLHNIQIDYNTKRYKEDYLNQYKPT